MNDLKVDLGIRFIVPWSSFPTRLRRQADRLHVEGIENRFPLRQPVHIGSAALFRPHELDVGITQVVRPSESV